MNDRATCRLSEGLDPEFLKIIPPGSAAFDGCQCAVALLKLSRRFADVRGGADVPVVHRPKQATARGLQAMGAPSAGPSAARRLWAHGDIPVCPGELGVTLAPASRRQAECVWAVVAHAA
jgi:hypothetical protein